MTFMGLASVFDSSSSLLPKQCFVRYRESPGRLVACCGGQSFLLCCLSTDKVSVYLTNTVEDKHHRLNWGLLEGHEHSSNCPAEVTFNR